MKWTFFNSRVYDMISMMTYTSNQPHISKPNSESEISALVPRFRKFLKYTYANIINKLFLESVVQDLLCVEAREGPWKICILDLTLNLTCIMHASVNLILFFPLHQPVWFNKNSHINYVSTGQLCWQFVPPKQRIRPPPADIPCAHGGRKKFHP